MIFRQPGPRATAGRPLLGCHKAHKGGPAIRGGAPPPPNPSRHPPSLFSPPHLSWPPPTFLAASLLRHPPLAPPPPPHCCRRWSSPLPAIGGRIKASAGHRRKKQGEGRSPSSRGKIVILLRFYKGNGACSSLVMCRSFRLLSFSRSVIVGC